MAAAVEGEEVRFATDSLVEEQDSNPRSPQGGLGFPPAR
jgi:hypothetical protein